MLPKNSWLSFFKLTFIFNSKSFSLIISKYILYLYLFVIDIILINLDLSIINPINHLINFELIYSIQKFFHIYHIHLRFPNFTILDQLWSCFFKLFFNVNQYFVTLINYKDILITY